MKTSYPPISRVCLFLGLLLILLGQVAEAQVGWSDEPVFPVTPSIMSTGRWYITGGARWRQGQRVSFDKTGASGGFSVPFGPSLGGYFGLGGYTPGYPQSPTGSSSDNPDTSGLWIYNNGLINPNNPNMNSQQSSPITDILGNTIGSFITNPGDSAYSLASAQQIGRALFTYINPSTGVTGYSTYNIGSFSVAGDPTKTLNKQFGVYDPNAVPALRWTSTTTFTASTNVRFNYNLNANQLPQPPTQAPILPQVGDDGFGPQAFDNWLWTPYLEIGLQTESMFDIFYSFSAFSFGNSFGKTVPALFYPVANSFTDYYSFTSTDPLNPKDFPNFNSATSITGASATSVTVNNTGGTLSQSAIGLNLTIVGGTTNNDTGIVTGATPNITVTGGDTTNIGGILNQSRGTADIKIIGSTFINAGGVVSGANPPTTITGGTQSITAGTLRWQNLPATTITGGTTTITGGQPPQYLINPNSVWREFQKADGTTANPQLVSEHINVDLKATIFENRLAGRAKSFFGSFLGFTPELGVSLGGVFTLVSFRIDTNTTLAELGNPSNVLYAWTGGQSDKQFSFGGFAGVDLRMNLPNTFFGCSFDYSYMTDIRYSLQDIQCFINPGGRSLNFFWGLRF